MLKRDQQPAGYCWVRFLSAITLYEEGITRLPGQWILAALLTYPPGNTARSQ